MRSGDAFDSVQKLLAEVLEALRAGTGTLSPLIRVCQACVALLPVDGASVSMMTGTEQRQRLYASDAVVEHIEDVQFTLGEGPCVEAFNTGRPVLVPDLALRAAHAWPMFANQVGDQVGAIFAFPLRRGAARLGAIDMYRREPGWLSDAELATALQIADIATSALLAGLPTGPDGRIDADSIAELVHDGTAAVHQATGMVIAETGLTPEQALARLRGYAFAAGRLLKDVAADVVAGRLHPSVIDT